MRILLAALALLLGAHLAQAAVLTNVTNLSFDPGHGTQIEYVAPNGTSFLWYPGNTMVLPGRWNTVPAQHGQAAQICFDYGPRSYNPVTRVYGGECELLTVYTAVQVERATGDIFGLAHRSAVPFALSRDKTTLAALSARLGLKASAATTAPAAATAPGEPAVPGKPITVVLASGKVVTITPEPIPTCADVLAHQNEGGAATIEAGLTYYHGILMGRHCVDVDYVKAFSMLRQAGDKADIASLTSDLKLKAASGNVKAATALEQLGIH